MSNAIIAQAWTVYPDDRASRLVYMTAHGMRASVARQYAEGPCGRGQNPKRDGCTAAKERPGGGGAVHGPMPAREAHGAAEKSAKGRAKRAHAKLEAVKAKGGKPGMPEYDKALAKFHKELDAHKSARASKEQSPKPAATKRAPTEAQKEKAEDRAYAKELKRQAKAKADSDFKTGGAKGRERARDEAIAKRRDAPAAKPKRQRQAPFRAGDTFGPAGRLKSSDDPGAPRREPGEAPKSRIPGFENFDFGKAKATQDKFREDQAAKKAAEGEAAKKEQARQKSILDAWTSPGPLPGERPEQMAKRKRQWAGRKAGSITDLATLKHPHAS